MALSTKKNKLLLLPENGERFFSTTYVSDLIKTIIRSIEGNTHSGVYNVITNPKSSIREIIEIASKYLKSDFTIVNGSADFLIKNNISQWTDMPLWINGDHFTFSNQKLKDNIEVNLTSFKNAIENTIEYYNNLDWPEPKYGLTDIKRLRLIKKINKSNQ